MTAFVTEEIVRAALDAADKAYDELDHISPVRDGTEHCMRAALSAAVPLWLAQVQAASEHTADYQIAAAAEELRRVADTEEGSTT